MAQQEFNWKNKRHARESTQLVVVDIIRFTYTTPSPSSFPIHRSFPFPRHTVPVVCALHGTEKSPGKKSTRKSYCVIKRKAFFFLCCCCSVGLHPDMAAAVQYYTNTPKPNERLWFVFSSTLHSYRIKLSAFIFFIPGARPRRLSTGRLTTFAYIKINSKSRDVAMPAEYYNIYPPPVHMEWPLWFKRSPVAC